MVDYNVNTGSAGTVRLTITDSAGSATNNNSRIDWSVRFIERVSSGSTFGNDVPFSISWDGHNVLASGTFDFDWRGAGLQSTVIASGAFTYPHNSDGTGNVVIDVTTGNTGTSGGGTGVAFKGGITPATLTSPPGQITNQAAVRISDSQARLTWSQTNKSNGAPSSTAINVSVNNGDFNRLVNLGGAYSATVAMGANQKLVYQIISGNDAGYSNVATTNAVYGTPAAPGNVSAAKVSGSSNILVSFDDQVPYGEHTIEVWHGTVVGTTTTWDSSPLATLASGALSYTHVSPNTAQVHVYRVRMLAGSLASSYTGSNVVQLLAAPNAPTVPAMPATVDRAVATTFTWVHNAVDTSAQTAYEIQFSTDGGTTWAGSGKVTSTVQQYVIAANQAASNLVQSNRVRTWGAATTGGADGAGASPWSAIRTITYKTKPTATVVSPVAGAALTDSKLRVSVGFAQVEGATFVKAEVELSSAGVVLEDITSTLTTGIQLATAGQNGTSYSVRVRAQDSNGLWSAWSAATAFSVTYLPPVPAVVVATYLPDNGYAQLDVTIADPGSGQAAATTISIVRTIDDVDEIIANLYPVASALTFLDTLPTIHGTNTYTITTTTAQGSTAVTTLDLVTTECRRAYLSKGDSYDSVLVFGGNLSVDESLSVASSTVQASGRTKPIGLYGVEQDVQLKVTSYIFDGFGSTIDEARDILLLPGKACYRDASGRRVFGSVSGSISRAKVTRGNLSFTLTETS